MITAQEYEYTPQSVIGVKNFKEYYENGQSNLIYLKKMANSTVSIDGIIKMDN